MLFRSKAFLDKTEKNFETVFNTLKKYRTKDGGFVTYDKLTEGDRKILSARVNTLAEDLSKLCPIDTHHTYHRQEDTDTNA